MTTWQREHSTAHIRACDPASLKGFQEVAAELSRRGWYHSIELPDGSVIQGLLTLEQQRARLQQFPLPQDLRGKRVLDIGAWDGWFSFEMERRGADVVAVDQVEQPGFRFAHRLLSSCVEYHILDVNELSPERLGRFDIVLFLGVLYHLKHPLLGLEKVCALTKEMALIESFVTDEGAKTDVEENGPVTMEFYETDELAGRADNWVGPSTRCLLSLCRTAGFARENLISVTDQRAHVACYRHWEPIASQPSTERAVITDALNVPTHGSHLYTSRDDYLSIWFRSPECALDRRSVFPEIGGYGIQPIYVGLASEGVWQANCRIPPGLEPGWHQVRIRTSGSGFSDPARIAIDLQPSLRPIQQLTIVGVTDGDTWEPNRVQLSGDDWFSLWVSGLPVDVEREYVKVEFGGASLYVSHVAAPDGRELRQINAKLPSSTLPGEYPVQVSYGETSSTTVTVEVTTRKED